MAHQPHVPHDTLAPDVYTGRSYVFARLLSKIFHPILMNVVSFLIIGYAALATDRAGLRWAALCILAQVLPPTLFYTVRKRQGVYSDDDVSRREQRHELYVAGFASALVATIALGLVGAPWPFLALLISLLTLGVIGGAINVFWKISVHSAAIAMTATIALLYAQSLGVALWGCALAVGWARIRTHNHTPMQVAAGFMTATVIVLLVFRTIA